MKSLLEGRQVVGNVYSRHGCQGSTALRSPCCLILRGGGREKRREREKIKM